MAAPTKGFLGKLFPTLLGRHVLQRSPTRWPSCSCGRRPDVRYYANDNTERKYVPRRAILYVPGNDERKLNKIPALDLDCVVMDCEDGVAINRKEEARSTIYRMLDELEFGRTDIGVRVNAMTSGLAEEDMAMTLMAKRLPSTIILPKVDDKQHIEWFAEQMSMNLKKRADFCSPNFVICMESARSLLNLQSICERALELSEMGAPFHLDGIVFGSDDYCADIGATRTKDAMELLYARQKVVTVAKAYRIQAIDLVHIDYKDTEGVRRQALEGARMGFSGKQVIHPDQVPIVQEAFSASEERIAWARELIEGFNEHQSSGTGAFVFRDSMIDMPLVRQARNILQTVQAVDDYQESSEKVEDVVQGEDSTEKVEPKDESPTEADGEKK